MKYVLRSFFCFQLLLACLKPNSLNAQASVDGVASADTVRVGIYITTLRNIDFQNSSFSADLWVWFTYKNHFQSEQGQEDEHYKKFPDCLEWPHAVDANNGGQPHYQNLNVDDSTADLIWQSARVSSPFRKRWNLVNYPFDVQHVSLSLESADYEKDDLVLVSDKKPIYIDPNFKRAENEWEILNEKFEDSTVVYQTNFGDPNYLARKDTNSYYSSVVLSFDLKRKGRWVTFFKLFTGILISFLLGLSVFLVKPTNLDARFGLCIGSMFSAIGSKYIVDGIIPMNYQNTLFDYIHNLTFFYIFIITIVSIFSLRWLETENIKLHQFSRKLDQWGLVVCSISYFVIIFAMVYSSIQH